MARYTNIDLYQISTKEREKKKKVFFVNNKKANWEPTNKTYVCFHLVFMLIAQPLQCKLCKENNNNNKQTSAKEGDDEKN